MGRDPSRLVYSHSVGSLRKGGVDVSGGGANIKVPSNLKILMVLHGKLKYSCNGCIDVSCNRSKILLTKRTISSTWHHWKTKSAKPNWEIMKKKERQGKDEPRASTAVQC